MPGLRTTYCIIYDKETEFQHNRIDLRPGRPHTSESNMTRFNTAVASDPVFIAALSTRNPIFGAAKAPLEPLDSN
jgi:hypothetical protein